MNKVFVVFKTDFQHSYPSRDLIGVCKSMKRAINVCYDKAEKEHMKIDKNQLHNLTHLKQTQGYGNGEFVIEEVSVDVLI